MADQPSWMQDSGAVPPPPAAPPANSTRAAAGGDSAGYANGRFVRIVFHFVNMGLSVLMAFSAVTGAMEITDLKIDDFFLALYLLVFAILLFMYETVRVVARCEGPNRLMRQNFGFFFGAKGRGIYLVFVGFLNFGLDNDFSLWTGIGTLVWGGITIAAYMSRPEWFELPKPAQPQAA